MSNMISWDANTELGSQKPPLGGWLDREHPRLQGCQFFAPLNENAGGYAYDAMTGRRGSLFGTPLPSWTTRPGGLSFANPAALTPAQYAVFPSSFDPNCTPHTLCFLLELAGLASTYNDVFYALDAGGRTAAGWIVTIQSNFQVAVGGANFNRFTNANAIPSAGRFALAVTYDGSGLTNGGTASGIRVYVNGLEAAYANTTVNGAPVAAPGNWMLSYDDRGSGVCGGLSGSLYAVAAFNRVLSRQEIWSFRQQPFAAFAATPPLAWEEEAAAYAAVLRHLAQLCA